MTLAPNCRDAGPVIAANQSEQRADLQKLFFRSCAACPTRWRWTRRNPWPWTLPSSELAVFLQILNSFRKVLSGSFYQLTISLSGYNPISSLACDKIIIAYFSWYCPSIVHLCSGRNSNNSSCRRSWETVRTGELEGGEAAGRGRTSHMWSAQTL